MFCTPTGKEDGGVQPFPVPAHLLGLNSSPTQHPVCLSTGCRLLSGLRLFCLLSLLSQLPVGRALSASHVGKGKRGQSRRHPESLSLGSPRPPGA